MSNKPEIAVKMEEIDIKGYIESSVINSGGNLNDYKENGLYVYYSDTINAPSASYGYLNVIKWENNWCVQIAYSNNKSYLRHLAQGEWGKWEIMINSSQLNTDRILPEIVIREDNLNVLDSVLESTSSNDKSYYRRSVNITTHNASLGGGFWLLEGYRVNELYEWQFARTYTAGECKYRAKYEGTWGVWKRLITTGEFRVGSPNILQDNYTFKDIPYGKTIYTISKPFDNSNVQGIATIVKNDNYAKITITGRYGDEVEKIIYSDNTKTNWLNVEKGLTERFQCYGNPTPKNFRVTALCEPVGIVEVAIVGHNFWGGTTRGEKLYRLYLGSSTVELVTTKGVIDTYLTTNVSIQEKKIIVELRHKGAVFSYDVCFNSFNKHSVINEVVSEEFQ